MLALLSGFSYFAPILNIWTTPKPATTRQIPLQGFANVALPPQTHVTKSIVQDTPDQNMPNFTICGAIIEEAVMSVDRCFPLELYEYFAR